MAAWVRPVADGSVAAIWVVPGASRAGVVGLHGDALRIRVTAAPEHGAANRESVRLLATLLGLPRGHVSLSAGAGGRRKSVHIRGLTPSDVRQRLLPAASVDRSGGRN
jgi:uncharacterized protein (TIGR00251 family)